MDTETNELIRGTALEKLIKDHGVSSYEARQFTPVPKELEHAAEVKLAGQDRAIVSKTSGGKLSKWAAQQRKAKRKNKHKAQKAARRRNRR